VKQYDFWHGETEPVGSSEPKKARHHIYYLKNRERYLAHYRANYVKNRDVLRAKARAKREAQPEEMKARARLYARKRREKNPERFREYEKAYREKNSDRMREIEKRYREAHREQLRAKHKAYYERHREEILAKDRERGRRTHLQRTYGITREKWNEIFEKQGKKCAICRTSKFNREPHTDHCHGAGHIRGILCAECNLLIGQARNSPRVLRAAAKYIEREEIFNQNAP